MAVTDIQMDQILTYIQSQRYVTARTLRFKFGISGHQAGAILARLARDGTLIEQSRSVRKVLYMNSAL